MTNAVGPRWRRFRHFSGPDGQENAVPDSLPVDI
jgi:hypothetical protein